MKLIAIPDDLNIENTRQLQAYDYLSSKEVIRRQINLKKHTFSFLIDGTKEVFLNDSNISIDNSEFILMKSGHCMMTEKLSDSKNYRSLLLFFTNDNVQQFSLKYGLKQNGIEPKNDSVYKFEYDNYIKLFVSSVLDVLEATNTLQEKLLTVKFEELLLYISEKYGGAFLQALTYQSNDSAQRFISIVESNQFKKLALEELAFLCHMSVSTFKREFEKHYSITPIKWFHNKRMERAKYMLCQLQKNPSEIYPEIGYQNLSSFIQAFKEKYGITPKQLQQQTK